MPLWHRWVLERELGSVGRTLGSAGSAVAAGLSSAALGQLPQSSLLEAEPPGELEGEAGLVLVGLQLGVVVRKLVVEDGDGHAVEDDAKGDAAKRHHPAKHRVGHGVSIAHGGEADLGEE